MTGDRLSHSVNRYMNGWCAPLALAIHDWTGWPVVQEPCYHIYDCEYCEGDGCATHALIELPDGRVLDAEGLHPGWAGYVPFNPDAWWGGFGSAFTGAPNRLNLLWDAAELLCLTGWPESLAGTQ